MRFRMLLLAMLVCAWLVAPATHADAPSVTVGAFKQDVAKTFTTESGLPSNNVTAIAVAGDRVFAGTDKGLAEFDGTAWKARGAAAVSTLTPHNGGVAAVAGGKILHVLPASGESELSGAPAGTVYAIASADGIAGYSGLLVATSNGLYTVSNGAVKPDETLNALLGDAKALHTVASDATGIIAVGGDAGLFYKRADSKWSAMYPVTPELRAWAPRAVRAVAFTGTSRLWFGSPQGIATYDDNVWQLWDGDDGLPYNQLSGAALGPNGEVWFSSNKGAIRFEEGVFNYRQGRRWLPADDVRGVAVDAKGSAWFATAAGVGVIERRPMTFAEKATWYEDEIDKYHRRTEYGYVLESNVDKPGDKSSHKNRDSDNDGLWTGMYGAGECFAYGATKDPQAKERAKQAFEAMRFLTIAPIDGEVDQQPGYVARTVVETNEPDPNLRGSYTLEGQKENQKGDSLWKAYVPRWPLSKDKKHWYKSDTSSDELDGHYFFYALYYDLVADSDEEKARVRELVVNLTDHLLRNNYCLVDHDGTPTRWAIYSPEKLNRDPLWSWERGLNSLSMLSYLTTAEHMTGDSKYTGAITELCEKHAYDVNAINAKLQQGYGSGNHSDDEMAIMCFYNLLKYTKNEELKSRMSYAFYRYMSHEWQEMNPFFNFAYAALGQDASFTNAYGAWQLDPWEGWLDDSVDTLKRFPLDRFNWAQENSHRLDIIMLPRAQRGDPVEPWDEVKNRARGHSVNGKVIPVDERHFNHWNTDPWDLDYG
ncbi:MAG: hypothetical protein SGI88_06690, partial [Candidatus Hydrogenedentes bacterium]|nr:hypothetical protein [Candidatus Hydrogenedentota bacterium]